jgi:predicted dehydrogenase
MKYSHFTLIVFILLNTYCTTKKENEVRLITLDPGHFHAALVQKTSYPQVSKNVFVYAPDESDVAEHLKKIEAYNTRSEQATHWKENIYIGEDYLEKMIRDKKGNVVVLAGNNGKKIDYIHRAVSAGLNVLADKPMVIRSSDFDKLKDCFDIAARKGVLLYDIMTERFEIASILQKEFSLLSAVYGVQQKGSPEDPGVVKESVHHFFKTVSGNPLKRPAWFFDTEQQGEGIVDVTTHLVDLVQWACFPNQIIKYQTDIELLNANHWSTPLSFEQFKEVTGMDVYPEFLQKNVSGDTLNVFSNGDITYQIKGVNVKVSVIWNYTYPEGGGDTHYSIMKGSKAHLIIEQGKAQNYKPTLYIKAVVGEDLATYEKDLNNSLQTVAVKYPGIGLKKIADDSWVVEVPEKYHNGHEAHFGQVTENYLHYLLCGAIPEHEVPCFMQSAALPEWEVPNMLAKYYITTQALEIAKK